MHVIVKLPLYHVKVAECHFSTILIKSLTAQTYPSFAAAPFVHSLGCPLFHSKTLDLVRPTGISLNASLMLPEGSFDEPTTSVLL